MWRNLISLSLTLLLLSGCGFQLRGTYLVPEQFKALYLQSDSSYSALTRAVKKRFKSAQIQLLNQPETGSPRVELKRDNLERSNLTLFADGQVAEYRLFYSVVVKLVDANGNSQQFKLQAQRDYLDDPGQALAKSREMEMLLQEMQAEIADQLLRRLSTFQEQNA